MKSFIQWEASQVQVEKIYRQTLMELKICKLYSSRHNELLDLYNYIHHVYVQRGGDVNNLYEIEEDTESFFNELIENAVVRNRNKISRMIKGDNND